MNLLTPEAPVKIDAATADAAVMRWVDQSTEHPVVLFDGHCLLCSRSVNFILQRETEKRLRFAALQSRAGRALCESLGVAAERLDSFILIEDGRAFYYSTASLRLCAYLREPWIYFRHLLRVPECVRDGFYHLIARNRFYLAGRAAECRVPSARDQERFL